MDVITYIPYFYQPSRWLETCVLLSVSNLHCSLRSGFLACLACLSCKVKQRFILTMLVVYLSVHLPAAAALLLTMVVAACIDSTSCSASKSNYSYPFSFFNLSTGNFEANPIGIIEIFACSLSLSQSYLSVSTFQRSESVIFLTILSRWYNK
jgi:hypothetical protein